MRQVIDAAEIVPGDVVKIKYGDKIPADVRILWATDDMAVDNSSLTGEPEPIRRTNVCTDDNPLETSNLAFFGEFLSRKSQSPRRCRVACTAPLTVVRPARPPSVTASACRTQARLLSFALLFALHCTALLP